MKQNLNRLLEIGRRAGVVVQPVRRYDVDKRIRRWGLTDDQRQMIKQAYDKLLSNKATAEELARFQGEYKRRYGSFSCRNDEVWICIERRDITGWHRTEAMRDLEDYYGLIRRLEPKKVWWARILSMCLD